jgi:ribosomal protein L15
MAGTGKRGDQRKTSILKLGMEEYFGKRKTRMAHGKIKLKTLNLDRISSIKDGADFSDYKVVGQLNKNMKINITAGAASHGAIKSVEKHGGKITLKAE